LAVADDLNADYRLQSAKCKEKFKIQKEKWKIAIQNSKLISLFLIREEIDETKFVNFGVIISWYSVHFQPKPGGLSRRSQ
jgi:hypothetical protein